MRPACVASYWGMARTFQVYRLLSIKYPTWLSYASSSRAVRRVLTTDRDLGHCGRPAKQKLTSQVRLARAWREIDIQCRVLFAAHQHPEITATCRQPDETENTRNTTECDTCLSAVRQDCSPSFTISETTSDTTSETSRERTGDTTGETNSGRKSAPTKSTTSDTGSGTTRVISEAIRDTTSGKRRTRATFSPHTNPS
jgi:hypothetical protein